MRLIVADDAVLIREGIVRLLLSAGHDVVTEVGDAEQLLDAVRRDVPDVVITDIRMPPDFADDGLVAAETIKRESPSVGVLILSQYVESRYADVVAQHGRGLGYLLKERVTSRRDLLDAVERVAAGGTVLDPDVVRMLLVKGRVRDPFATLTEREREVLGLMAEGFSNSAISTRLHLSAKTVEKHVSSVFQKLGLSADDDVNRRVQAVVAFLRAST